MVSYLIHSGLYRWVSLPVMVGQLHRNTQFRETLKNRYSGKAEKARTLVSVFESHNHKMEVLVGEEFEKEHTATIRTLPDAHQRFHAVPIYNISDIQVNKIDFTFLNDFEYYLRSVTMLNSPKGFASG